MRYKSGPKKVVVHLLLLALAGIATSRILPGHTLSASTPPDMVSRWSAEGNANDSVGLNHGLLQTGVMYVPGKLGLAFNFDGNSFIEIANSPTLEPSRITTSAWVRSFGSPGTYRYVLSKGLQDCDASSYGLYTGANGGLSFYVYDGNAYVLSPEKGTEFWDGNWHYVAGTYDGAAVRLYVDGVEVGTGTPAAISINYALSTDQKFYVGAQSDSQAACGLTTKFIGDIDEAKVWNRALSASEIHDDFATDNNAIPVAADQFVATDKNTSVAITLTASDPDGDPLTYSIEAGPSHAILSGTAPNLTYTPNANYNGSDSFTFKANDGTSDSNIGTVSLTVRATPTLNWSNPADIIYGTALTSAQLNTTANVPGTFIYTPASGTVLPAGSNQTLSVIFTPTDTVNYTVAARSVSINVINLTRATTTSSLTISASPRQYSDRETFEATLTPSVFSGQLPARSVTFKVGTQVLGTAPMILVGGAYKGTLADVPLLEPTPYGTGPTRQMQPAPLGRIATAEFNDVSPNYSVTNATRSFVISKEDARTSYTGPTFVSTSGSGVSTATVSLSATIKDISVTVEANGDTSAGDVRNATVTFIDRDTGLSISPSLNVTLPNTSETAIGTVSYNWPVDIGRANSQTYRVGMLVSNYYTRNSIAEDTLVTIAKPITTGFIAGGGSLAILNSSGLKAGEVGSSNDFGFSVKYNGQGSSPTGNFNTIVRSRVSGLLRVYQVKGSMMTSLVLNGNKATLRGTATIYDITNGSSLVGNATFEVSITDNGEPGSSDTIAITIRDSANALWFSSNWNGLRTAEQLLDGGNIRLY